MATIGISPLDYYTINSFAFSDSWQIPHGSAMQIYFILTQTDTLGTRRYIPTAGSVVTVNFMRQRTLNTITPGSTSAQTVSKTATILDPRDSSLYTIMLTADDTKAIITGGAQLQISVGGNISSYSVPYMVKKIRSNAGC